jgi:adenine phosphoribosyltransferase
MDLKDYIRDVPDFPYEGILFRDITPLLLNPEAFEDAVKQTKQMLDGIEYDVIAAPESRGFIVGIPLAQAAGKGFIPARKAGKLPYKTVSQSYDLEYGSATIEIHADAIKPGQRVVIADDLLATGGTCSALCKLIEAQGGIVAGIVFLIELSFLGGRDVLMGYDVMSVLKY